MMPMTDGECEEKRCSNWEIRSRSLSHTPSTRGKFVCVSLFCGLEQHKQQQQQILLGRLELHPHPEEETCDNLRCLFADGFRDSETRRIVLSGVRAW